MTLAAGLFDLRPDPDPWLPGAPRGRPTRSRPGSIRPARRERAEAAPGSAVLPLAPPSRRTGRGAESPVGPPAVPAVDEAPDPRVAAAVEPAAGAAAGVVDAPTDPDRGPRDRPVGPVRSDDEGQRRSATPGPPPSRTVVQLLGAARDELRAAQEAGEPGERFRSAHLGALRAAAAVLALRARPRRSARPTDAWTLLASVAPEYAEWAAFFGAHSATRSAVEAGVRGRVSQRDADDMVRQADLFLALVTRTVAGRGR